MRGIPLAFGLRLARHYGQRLVDATRRLTRAGQRERAQILEALRQDWPQIEAWQRWTAEGTEPERLAACVDFARDCLPALAVLLPPAGQLRWTLQALACARAQARAETERQLLFQAGLLHKDLEQVQALQDLALQFLGQAQAAGDALATGRARLLQAQVAEMRECRDEAQAHYAASRALLEPRGPSVELVEIWSGLTRRAFYGGQHAQALSCALQQLEVALALGAVERIGAAHLSVTGAANFVGERALSLHHAEQALACGTRSGSLRLTAHAHVTLGHACRRLGRLGEALAYYQQGIAAPPSALPPSNLANAYQGLAETHEALGNADEALLTFERVLALAQALPAVPNFRVCQAARATVRLRLARGDRPEARTALLAHAHAALRLDAAPQFLDVLIGVARCALAEGDAALAARCAVALHRHAHAAQPDSRADLAQVLQAAAYADRSCTATLQDGPEPAELVRQLLPWLEPQGLPRPHADPSAL